MKIETLEKANQLHKELELLKKQIYHLTHLEADSNDLTLTYFDEIEERNKFPVKIPYQIASDFINNLEIYFNERILQIVKELEEL